MASLSNITVKDGAGSALLCTANTGTTGVDHSIMTLQGAQWSVQSPNNYLKQKVLVTATIHRSEGDKSFAKAMYVTRVSMSDQSVGLNAKQPS
jgi:hypothetical protein